MDPQNPITLLLPLLGILLILGAVWLTGGSAEARIDRELLRRRLAEDLPDFAAAEMAIADDGRAAIAAESHGPALAIAFVVGDKIAVRRLGPGEAHGVTLDGDRLLIVTGDFTHGSFALSLPGAAEHWAGRAAPLLAEARRA